MGSARKTCDVLTKLPSKCETLDLKAGIYWIVSFAVEKSEENPYRKRICCRSIRSSWTYKLTSFSKWSISCLSTICAKLRKKNNHAFFGTIPQSWLISIQPCDQKSGQLQLEYHWIKNWVTSFFKANIKLNKSFKWPDTGFSTHYCAHWRLCWSLKAKIFWMSKKTCKENKGASRPTVF